MLMAGLMSLNALAIDAMIPALPAIGETLGVASHNERQLVVSFYLFGFGLTQLVYGPLSDRYGRKPLLLTGVGLYVVFALALHGPESFQLLLAGGCSGRGGGRHPRIVMAIVRDRYEGSAMAG